MAALGAIFAARQLLFIKKVDKVGNESIYDILDQNFSNGLFKDREDIQIIINSVSRTKGEVYSMAPILKDYYTNRLAESSSIPENTSKLNRWSVPLAICGVFFTVLFGVLSFKPNEIDYNKIKTENQILLDEKFKQFIEQTKTDIFK